MRSPAVAGSFYPATASSLEQSVDQYLKESEKGFPSFPTDRLKGIVVPHAGYIYSGATAGFAYRSLLKQTYRFKQVILLGPAHRAYVDGIALPRSDAFLTPLGSIKINQGLRDSVQQLPFVSLDDLPHEAEHSLEVQLPFLQKILRDFEILPAVLGRVSPSQVCEFLNLVGQDPQCLIVISTDLSHFHPYDLARKIDQKTLAKMLALEPIEDPSQACGSMAVNGWLRFAQEQNLKPTLLDYRNSGDTAGSKKEVVGYSAFAFTS